MQGVEICKRNQHIPHYRKRKDAKSCVITCIKESQQTRSLLRLYTIYSYAATRLLHDDACILHLLPLLGQRDVVDARTHAVGSHGY